MRLVALFFMAAATTLCAQDWQHKIEATPMVVAVEGKTVSGIPFQAVTIHGGQLHALVNIDQQPIDLVDSQQGRVYRTQLRANGTGIEEMGWSDKTWKTWIQRWRTQL